MLVAGFTNEAVPLNDEHYFLPAWQRFVIRTSYTAIITILGQQKIMFRTSITPWLHQCLEEWQLRHGLPWRCQACQAVQSGRLIQGICSCCNCLQMPSATMPGRPAAHHSPPVLLASTY